MSADVGLRGVNEGATTLVLQPFKSGLASRAVEKSDPLIKKVNGQIQSLKIADVDRKIQGWMAERGIIHAVLSADDGRIEKTYQEMIEVLKCTDKLIRGEEETLKAIRVFLLAQSSKKHASLRNDAIHQINVAINVINMPASLADFANIQNKEELIQKVTGDSARPNAKKANRTCKILVDVWDATIKELTKEAIADLLKLRETVSSFTAKEDWGKVVKKIDSMVRVMNVHEKFCDFAKAHDVHELLEKVIEEGAVLSEQTVADMCNEIMEMLKDFQRLQKSDIVALETMKRLLGEMPPPLDRHQSFVCLVEKMDAALHYLSNIEPFPFFPWELFIKMTGYLPKEDKDNLDLKKVPYHILQQEKYAEEGKSIAEALAKDIKHDHLHKKNFTNTWSPGVLERVQTFFSFAPIRYQDELFTLLSSGDYGGFVFALLENLCDMKQIPILSLRNASLCLHPQNLKSLLDANMDLEQLSITIKDAQTADSLKVLASSRCMSSLKSLIFQSCSKIDENQLQAFIDALPEDNELQELGFCSCDHFNEEGLRVLIRSKRLPALKTILFSEKWSVNSQLSLQKAKNILQQEASTLKIAELNDDE